MQFTRKKTDYVNAIWSSILFRLSDQNVQYVSLFCERLCQWHAPCYSLTTNNLHFCKRNVYRGLWVTCFGTFYGSATLSYLYYYYYYLILMKTTIYVFLYF